MSSGHAVGLRSRADRTRTESTKIDLTTVIGYNEQTKIWGSGLNECVTTTAMRIECRIFYWFVYYVHEEWSEHLRSALNSLHRYVQVLRIFLMLLWFTILKQSSLVLVGTMWQAKFWAVHVSCVRANFANRCHCRHFGNYGGDVPGPEGPG